MRKDIILLIISLFLFSFVSAGVQDDLDEGMDTLQGIEDNIPTNQDELKETAGSYLRQEWGKILEGNKFGEFLLKISDSFKNFNFGFKFIFGIEYSLSWLFFLSIAFWVVILLMIYFALKAIFLLKGGANIGISVIATIIGAQFELYIKLVELISPYLKNNWYSFGLLILLIAFMYFYVYLMKSLTLYTAKTIRKRKKEERALRQKFKDEVDKAEVGF